MLLSDYISQVQELVHDTAGIDFTTAELTNWVNNARKRVALDFHNVRYLFQNASIIGGQEQYPIANGITGLTITNPGSLYLSAPAITIGSPSAGGTQATAVAVLNSTGQVSQINMTNWGGGYGAVPTVSIAAPGGGGTQATATAQAALNVFDIGSVTPLWGTQRYTMGWLPWQAFEAFCRANPTLQRQPAVWTTFQEQNILFFYPIPDQTYLIDLEAIGLPLPLVNTSDFDAQILDPPADCVQFYAARFAMLHLQKFPEAQGFEDAYKRRALEIQLTRQTRRVPNIYRNWMRRIQRW